MFSTRAAYRGGFVVLFLSSIFVSGISCLAQSDKPDDLDQKLNFRVPVGRVEGSFVDALGETARAFNIPMGISWVNTASSQRKRAVEYKDATVLEIIQDIARTEPGYEVRIANNVVHVATTDVPFSHNFLYLKISQFSGTGVAAVVKAGLWELLNQQIAPNPPKGYAASIFHSPSDPKLDMQFTNATVEEILDAIGVASEEKVWVVTFAEDPNPTPTGFRRTDSFTSKAIPADSDQPVWDIFRWDYWPVELLAPANSEAANGSSVETHQILNTALVPEQQTTLRVGESAVLRIPSDHEYSIISTGDVLVPVRRSQVGVIYRAVQPGQQTIVLNPHVSQGDCVSCASHHYFITVRAVH
jgi:hypothetical protein